MVIQGIGASEPVTLGDEKPTNAQGLGKDAFMTLLVQQLKNQDPLSPTDNQAFIAQLAEFSSLEEMQELNQNIVGLAVLQQSNALMSQLTDSSALIGKTVVYEDPQGGDPLEGVVDSVKLEDGLAILVIDGQDVPLVNVTEVTGGAAAESGESGDGAGDGSGDDGSTASGGGDSEG
jgi:flagellar basal-body rod modification protein FlgD